MQYVWANINLSYCYIWHIYSVTICILCCPLTLGSVYILILRTVFDLYLYWYRVIVVFFLPCSPTVRLSNSTNTTNKSKAHPISATNPTEAPQNVYPTQRPPSANQRKTPPSRSGAVNNSFKVRRGAVKKDSTDESSSDDTEESSDTN